MGDCGFTDGNYWFRYRAGGIIIHEDRLLFVKSVSGEHLYLVGGGVRLGETSASCIEREVFEETGMKAHAGRLAAVCENFFRGVGGTIDGLDCHAIELTYIMDVPDDGFSACRSVTDSGEELLWVPLDRIGEYNIKPVFFAGIIGDILSGSGCMHIIEERDRKP